MEKRKRNKLKSLPDGFTLDSLKGVGDMMWKTNTNLSTLPDGFTLDSLTIAKTMFKHKPLSLKP